jgi:hypothetical protein
VGNRAQVVFQYELTDKEIYFYSHWDGLNLGGYMLANALVFAHDRWDDDAYCTRILVTKIVEEAGALEDLTGYGLTPFTIDSNNPDTIVNFERQMVWYMGEDRTFDEHVERYANKE